LKNGVAVVIVVGDDIVLRRVVKGEACNLETVDKRRLALAPGQGSIIGVECKWSETVVGDIIATRQHGLPQPDIVLGNIDLTLGWQTFRDGPGVVGSSDIDQGETGLDNI
jgi:hypothetical protein